MPTFKNDVTGANEIAIVGTSAHHHGVAGESKEKGAGVLGVSGEGEGVSGFSKKGPGVVGQSDQGAGVRGLSKPGHAVEGLSGTGDAIVGSTDSGIGVSGSSSTGHGISGQSESGSGVRGASKSGRGVEGLSESTYGVSGDSTKSAGVRGSSVEGRGVEGWTTHSEGVFGLSLTGTGVWGVAGHSRFIDRIGAEATAVFRVGAAAKQWADSMTETKPERSANEPPPQAASVQPHAAADIRDQHVPERPLPVATAAGGGLAQAVVDGLRDVERFDDAAGIGVCGEHRGAGIGVKAVSAGGMGLAAQSTDYEAVHAETHSRQTAAIAAYNLNPAGTGAALFAKKAGTRGHAGFFDGKVWVGGELAVGGDIILANADCAEDFDVANAEAATPGTVMVIGADGVLVPSSRAYDKGVVGVVSGAGDYKPGVTLDKRPCSDNRLPISLLGKVYCKATAEPGAIEAGDLLTTSPVCGHAMKSSEPSKAFGTVIGKALRPLREGRGLIPILIALQ
jgi:hypothetical protein